MVDVEDPCDLVLRARPEVFHDIEHAGVLHRQKRKRNAVRVSLVKVPRLEQTRSVFHASVHNHVEQEMVPFAFTGVSLAHPRLFEGSPEGAFSLNAVWDTAIAAGRAYGMRMEGTWMHVGSPDALAQAEQQLTREIIS